MGAEAHEHVAAISRIKAKQANKLVRETRTTGAYEEVTEELAPRSSKHEEDEAPHKKPKRGPEDPTVHAVTNKTMQALFSSLGTRLEQTVAAVRPTPCCDCWCVGLLWTARPA